MIQVYISNSNGTQDAAANSDYSSDWVVLCLRGFSVAACIPCAAHGGWLDGLLGALKGALGFNGINNKSLQ